MRSSVVFVFSFAFLCLSAWGNTNLSKEECRVIVKDFERMSNVNPSEIEGKAPETLDKLRHGESSLPYFVAYNIYAENLFNRGKVEKARQEIETMLGEAFDQTNVECKVIALRTQGQFYYKLGLFERASQCFRNAMEICPRYDSPLLEYCFTWSSTLFWLVQSDIRTDRIEEANHLISQMDQMMQWLDSTGNIDHIGYKPVMIRGLKAKVELKRGNLSEAERLIDECPQFMVEGIPYRAYVEYYVTKMKLLVQQGNHQDALPILNQLIEMHIDDYKPIAAEYLYQKGLSLAELGRYDESTQTLIEYISLKDQINQMALAQQLDELSARMELEKLQHERENMRRQLLIVICICAALAIIIALVFISEKKIRRKNKMLARNISELNRLTRQTEPNGGQVIAEDEEQSNAEYLETGNKIVEYIKETKCYLRADCSRDTIRDGMGVAERVLSKAMVAATGMTFVNYINQLRLKVSIEMLEEKPEMTIQDISTACGFGSVRQFQRIFKQCYDMSPSAYREANTSRVQ